MAAPPISGYLFRSCFPLTGNDEAQLLRPRDPKGTQTARNHVRLASKPDYPTQWVSLTASSDWVLYYALKDYVTNNRQVLSKIMVFDRHRIPPQLSNRVLDLSTAEAWSSCPDTKDCKIKDPTKNYAISAEEWLLNAGDVTGSVWKQFTVGIVTIIDLEEPRAVRGGLLQRLVKILVADRIKVDAANLKIKDPKKHQVPVAMLSYKEWRKRLTAGFEGIYLTGRGGIHSWFTQLIRDKLVLLPAVAPVPGLPLPDSNAFDDAKRASIRPHPATGDVQAPAPAASSPRSPLADRSQLMREVITAGQKDLYKIACKVQQATNRPPIKTKGKGRSLEVVRRELLVEMENHTMEESAGTA